MHEAREAKKPRIWMKARTGPSGGSRFQSAEPVRGEHAQLLGILMKRAYEGTIDDEGETLDQCCQEVRGTLAGKYGPFLHDVSFVTFADGRIVSASLVTLYKGKPLLAYSMTDPDYQRRGLAGGLIRKSLDALASTETPELFLVVTVGNPAQKLYENLGFEVLGNALPQQPPPLQ